MKWRCQTSHLGRFTLWHKGRRATQLGKFTLWNNGRRAKQPALMHAPGVAHIFQIKDSDEPCCKIWRLDPRWILVRVFYFRKLLKDERFGRFSKHRSIVDLKKTLEISALYEKKIQQTFKRWTLYEDRVAELSKRLKDKRFPKAEYQQKFEKWTPRTHESPRELAHQSEAKRKQAPQTEANVCQNKCNLKKRAFLFAQDTQ